MSIKLRSLRFSNFLGVASEPVEIQFHPRGTVFCGPNNSGKTTVLTAVSLLYDLTAAPLFSFNSGIAQLVPHSAPVTQDYFNFRSQAIECVLGAEIAIERNVLQFSLDGDPNAPVRPQLEIELKLGSKRLKQLVLDGLPTFVERGRTAFFEWRGPQAYAQTEPRSAAVLSMPQILASRKVFFPSVRGFRIDGGGSHNLQELAEGMGIISWTRGAMNPEPRDPISISQHRLLRQFEYEYGEFAGFHSFSLSVPPSGNELTVHIGDNPIPISHIGSGMGECLLLMLVCKLAQELPRRIGQPPIELVLVEEPELHLHPTLQRRLIAYLLRYAEDNDMQLVMSTHSASVLNAVDLAGGSVYRTQYDGAKQQVLVNPVRATDRLLALLKDIGASPGDLLQADKVLWVEGPRDIPVFKAWLSKAPSFQNQTVPVLSLGGDDSASEDFDINQLLVLNPNCLVILDSERTGPSASAKATRLTTERKCRNAGIPCIVTERRSTENYFTCWALSTIYSGFESEVEPYARLTLYDPSFSKESNGRIAAAMDWSELAATDIGQALEGFLKR